MGKLNQPPILVFRSPRILLVSAVLLLGLAGCRSPLDRQPEGYRDWIERDPASWGLGGSATEHRRDTLLVAGSENQTLPADVEGWVAIALERHPGLRAARQRVNRLRERGPQVSSLEDPMLRVVPIGEQAQTAAGRVNLQTQLSQTLPFPGKLNTKAAMAERDAAAAEMELAAMRLEVAANVRRAYWSWRYAGRAVAVVRRDQELLQQFLQIAEAKYRAGTAEQRDVLRAQVELAGTEKQLLSLGQLQQSSGAMINRLLNRPIDASLPKAEPAADLSDLPEIEADLDRLLMAAARHPKLAALREQAAGYREQRRLANLDRYPDLTLSLNYNEVDDDGLALAANGDDQWFIGFGFNLPLWQGKRDAAEREALAGLYETAASLADQQNQLAFEVRDALTRVVTQRQTLELFERRMLPDAEQAVAAVESSYRAGSADFLTLIDNWRRLTGLRLTYEQAATQLQKDLADLRLATGWSGPASPAVIEAPPNPSPESPDDE